MMDSDAGSDATHELEMARRSAHIDHIGETPTAIDARWHAEPAVECPAKCLVTAEAAGERHLQYRLAGREQQGRRALESEPQCVLLGGLARHRSEPALRAEPRQTHARTERRE